MYSKVRSYQKNLPINNIFYTNQPYPNNQIIPLGKNITICLDLNQVYPSVSLSTNGENFPLHSPFISLPLIRWYKTINFSLLSSWTSFLWTHQHHLPFWCPPHRSTHLQMLNVNGSSISQLWDAKQLPIQLEKIFRIPTKLSPPSGFWV